MLNIITDIMDLKDISKVRESEDDSGHVTESDCDEVEVVTEDVREPVHQEIVWKNIFKFIVLHGLALVSLTLLPSLCWQSWIWLLVTYLISGISFQVSQFLQDISRSWNNCWSSQVVVSQDIQGKVSSASVSGGG